MHYPEKLPDKIYIPIVNDDKGGHPEVYWEDFPYPNVKDNAEYIRKDALLEWAKEYKVELLDSAKTMDTDSVGKCINSGALTMLDNVIDKIDSL